MSQTRIVLIPPTAAMPAPFLIVDPRGRVLQRGSLSLEAAEPRPEPRPELRTVAIAPGADILVRWLDLPVGGAAQLRAAARWMLKEHLAADPERLAIALGAVPVDGGPRMVAAVAAPLLEAWIDYLRALGVEPASIVPDCLVPPAPEAEATLNAIRFGGDVALRGRALAASVQSDLMDAVAAGRPVSLISDQETVEERLALAALHPPVDLLSALARPRSTSRGGWRVAAGLAAAVLISPLILTLAEAGRDSIAADRADRQARALIAEALPEAAQADDPLAEIRRRLAVAPPPGGFAAGSAALFAAVEQVEGAELDGLSADADQGLRATLSYPAFQDLDAIRSSIEASGLSLSDTSTVEDGGRVVSEVIVGGAA